MNNKKFERGAEREIENLLMRAGYEMEAQIKKRCPVETNRLRASITTQKEGDDVIIGTNVEYACVLDASTPIYNPSTGLSTRISKNTEEVLSKDGKTHNVENVIITSTKGQNKIKGISIKVRNGRKPLVVTENHLILCLREDNLIWEKAKNLKKTDKIFVKRAHNYKKPKVTICKNCNRKFKQVNYLNKEFCSQKCYHKYTTHAKAKGKSWKLSEKTKRKIGKANQGEKCSFWKGGKSFEPYHWTFNKELKRKIRERDKHTCQFCGRTEKEELNIHDRKLSVHHIDENKMNSNEENLITLCHSCHMRITNGSIESEIPEVNIEIFKPKKILGIAEIVFDRKNTKNHKIPSKYDLSVKGENSFIAGGILVHNSYVEFMKKMPPKKMWKAKAKKGGTGDSSMPFMRPVLYRAERIIEQLAK